MTSNALALPNIPDTMAMADQLFRSGFLPQSIKNAQQAFAIITLGQELGLGPWAALNGVSVIQGKPTVGPQAMLGMINRSGLLEDMKIEETDNSCSVTMKRKGRAPYTFTFTDADAQAMGLLGKDNWRKMKATMRRWRAINGCERIVFPDIINGMYPPEEIAPDLEVNEEGILVSQPTEITRIQAIKPAPALSLEAGDAVEDDSCWPREDIQLWIDKWEAKKVKRAELKAALGVQYFDDFCEGEDAADALVNAYLNADADAASELEQTA
jgi:hypothetical protein